MAVIQDIIAALWQHDFAALADPHIVSVVYFVMFATLFLENGLLPASFFPGDSLLILAGALIAQGVMDFLPTIAILTAAASLGCWLSYIQGRWLGNTKTVKGWLAQLPAKYHQRATGSEKTDHINDVERQDDSGSTNEDEIMYAIAS